MTTQTTSPPKWFDLNRLELAGRAGAPPDGQARYARLSLYNKAGDRTNHFRVVMFGDLAERAKARIRKGDRVLLWGHIESKKWTDPKTQETRTVLEIVADSFEIAARSRP